LLAFGFFVSPVTTRPETQGQLFFSLGKSDKPKYQTRAVSFAGAGERRQRTLELQFALPPVATRNGLAPPAQIGAPLIPEVLGLSSIMAGILLLGWFFLFG
jgi:hypothetical protein